LHKEKFKKLVNFLGKSLGILGILFVFYTLWQNYTLSSFTLQFMVVIRILPLIMLLNILSIIVGVYAWHVMLLHYATQPLPYVASYYYFTKTEIAKYLPGNVFHFLGRQALAVKVGITQIQMAKTSILFSFLLLTATLLASTLFAFLAHKTPLFILTLMVLSTMITIIVLIYIYPSFPVRNKLSMNGYLALSVALQGIMLGIIIFYQVETFSAHLFFQCIGIYTVSWLIGFVTPGASGGIGIREGTFILIANYLQVDISSDIIIFSVLLVRLINICVDIMMYISTYTLENKMKELKL